ncbi:aldo/keto reductase [Rossellomorea sp. YZS02]|uniref:aldo/keto reductase n=1 Tax=Rossellomorea sp. YZS02 TaxID=3097358 RepID=UPI002A16C247|nr:aldo/keto reductase [Rossellomorea sp. YZS02]MDX8343496.1 aldo/keto reductase [Rossellomorea sp. YZS02]
MISGYATLNETSRHCHKFNLPYRRSSRFLVSPIAIGTHLGEMNEEDSRLYKEGIQYALKNGINFIDTAINYRGMRSERDIGCVLNDLILSKKILNREAVIVSSKAGIIPGDVMENLVPKDYLQKKLLEPGIIQESDLNEFQHQRHVLNPSYYKFAIAKSKQHLNLDTIDIYYVHNPEISMMTLEPETFYNHLENLFLTLESQVQLGNIRYYGIATWNGFLKSPDEKGFISLEEVMNKAKAVAGDDHHFQFIQYPLNKKISQSLTFKNQRIQNKMYSLLHAAEELGLLSTTSAPFQLGKVFGKDVNPKRLLIDIIRTKGIFSTMVGMKQIKHIRENIESISMLE